MHAPVRRSADSHGSTFVECYNKLAPTKNVKETMADAPWSLEESNLNNAARASLFHKAIEMFVMNFKRDDEHPQMLGFHCH